MLSLSNMRLPICCVIAIGGVACVADPVAPGVDLAATDLGSDQGPAGVTVAWEPRRSGITGLRTRGVQTYNTHFFIDTPTSGIYYLGADAPAALPYIAAHPGESRLVWAYDGEPVIAVPGRLRRATGENGTWELFRGAIASTSLTSQYFETAMYSFALVEGLGIFQAPVGGTADFTFIKSTPTQGGFAPRNSDSAYVAKGGLGLFTFDPTDPGPNILVSGTGINLLSASAIGWGSRTIVGGVEDGMTRVKNVVQLITSDCGDPLGPSRSVLAVMPAGNFNYAVLDDHHVYINEDCTGAWTRGGQFSGSYVGMGITESASFKTVVTIGTSHSLYRSSDGGLTFTDLSGESPEVEILSIDVNPSNDQHLVVATDGRGLWHSLDAGLAWTRLEPGTFHGDLRLTARFSTGNTLLVGGKYEGSDFLSGGVFRGVYAATGWSFDRLGTGVSSEPPFSVNAIFPSTTLGPLGCFPTGPIFARYSGTAWIEALAIAAGDCTAIASSANGRTHWIGGLDKITVIRGDTPTTLTSDVLALPNSGAVRFIVSLDETASRLLIGADKGAFIVDGTIVSEVRFGTFSLGSVSALYEESTPSGARRIWLASAQEPLLVSTDGAVWERVATGTTPHPTLRGLVHAGGFLYAASATNVWRAALP